MTRHIEPFETDKDIHYDFPNNARKNKLRDGGKKNADDYLVAIKPASLAKILEVYEPPKTASSESSTPLKPNDRLFNTLPTYFPSTDYAKKNLEYMIDSHKILAEARDSEMPRVEPSKNPYEENLEKLID
eukprot:CAMPEP_0172323634 /NCGR_PEP_ID=MMETSP1058-20130122/49289_1 /TAXON_ID=83371 /ORGANISM="Detonula confervacea, Strain CCMP 353" /LENGTH=129 /DNA_ID=CAMNT_0013039689 /DNA_START=271 /DNA_END=661 /DNA_ORIENTATION=-